MKQTVEHKKIGPVAGMLLVAGLAALLILLNYVVIDGLALLVGYTAAAAGFWAMGILIAWLVIQLFVVRYIYELGDDVLRLNRSYGKRLRHIEDIYLNNLLFVGDPEEAKKRWPQARRVKARHLRVKEAVTAVVYKNASGTGVALIQANAELKAALAARVKRSK